jgi:DNA (cytosine-5)-methyltransferase 1
MKQEKIKSVELFAGAGGLGMGVSRSGFEAVQIVEWDNHCCNTLRLNKLNGVQPIAAWPLTHEDVRKISFKSHEGTVQLVTGGPPCQPFSLGGRHRAHTDARDMFPEAIRAIREIKPKAFIFENVKGLTRQSFRNYLEYVRLQMVHPEIVQRGDENWGEHLARLEAHETMGKSKGLTYNVIVHLANAADYGVPQRRERVFFVGFRSDLEIAWSFPTSTHSSEALAWSQYRDESYWERHSIHWRQRVFSERARARAWRFVETPNLCPWVTVRDAIHDLPDPELHPRLANRFSNHRFQPGARAYPGHTGSAIDEPAKTLKAGVHGVPGGENMLIRSDGSLRYFSIRESARLQTFPDDFIFEGTWTESMRQLGNAVPVQLAEIVAGDVFKALKEENGAQSIQSIGKTKSSSKH